MTLARIVAAPFQRAGSDHLTEQEFVVALSLHRDWFSPAQAKRAVERGVDDGLLERDDDGVRPTFDPSTVSIPPEFAPEDGILTRRSPFEWILERVVEAGTEKREAVREINRLQRTFDLRIEAAGALYARQLGVDVDDAIEEVLADMRTEQNGS